MSEGVDRGKRIIQFQKKLKEMVGFPPPLQAPFLKITDCFPGISPKQTERSQSNRWF